MLGGKMSNEDEDEVEDELEAMAREAQRVPAMPDAPTRVQEPLPDAPLSDPQRAKARAQERARQREGQQAVVA